MGEGSVRVWLSFLGGNFTTFALNDMGEGSVRVWLSVCLPPSTAHSVKCSVQEFREYKECWLFLYNDTVVPNSCDINRLISYMYTIFVKREPQINCCKTCFYSTFSWLYQLQNHINLNLNLIPENKSVTIVTIFTNTMTRIFCHLLKEQTLLKQNLCLQHKTFEIWI